MARLLIAIVFAVLVAIFAGQNARPVKITLFFWDFPRVSEALLLLFSLLLGVLLSILFRWRAYWGKKSTTPADLDIPTTPASSSVTEVSPKSD